MPHTATLAPAKTLVHIELGYGIYVPMSLNAFSVISCHLTNPLIFGRSLSWFGSHVTCATVRFLSMLLINRKFQNIYRSNCKKDKTSLKRYVRKIRLMSLNRMMLLVDCLFFCFRSAESSDTAPICGASVYGLLNVSSVNIVHIDRVISYKRHDHKRGVVYRLRCCTG